MGYICSRLAIPTNKINLNCVDIFVHLLFFCDAFRTSRVHKDKGHESIILSAGEFAYSNRWAGPKYPALLCLFCYSKKIKKQLSRNFFLSKITADMLTLSKGIDINGYRVFAYCGAILGDSPGRSEFAGLKIPSVAKKCCHICEITRENLMSKYDTDTYIEGRNESLLNAILHFIQISIPIRYNSN